MLGLLIADKDAEARNQMANLLIEAGYDIMVTNSAAQAIHGVLNKTTQILLLGRELNEFTSAELVPLLKKCNRNLMIILVADDTPLPLMRKVRKEGIFYHALRPVEPEGREEIKQAVKCAIECLAKTPLGQKPIECKKSGFLSKYLHLPVPEVRRKKFSVNHKERSL